MALLIGQPINGRELEQETSGWPPDRFAAMCDALAWAVSGRACATLPSFTNRVYAKDGGIDAEWAVDVPEDDCSVPTPILGSGWNVFQYKKRDLLAQDRKHIISTLKSSLKGAITEVVNRHKRHPDRYVLFVNVDLLSKAKAEIKESILKDYSEQSKIHVEIIGAAELASFFNNHPHLRAAYFTPLSFKTWEEANKSHHAQKLFGANVQLIGREQELKQLKAYVDDQRVRVIVLTGPHDMGKSRLSLEATQYRMHDVVVALDPRSMNLSDYRSLVSVKKEVVCVIEDPETEGLRFLVEEVLTIPSLKIVITLPSQDFISLPGYGLDERVQPLHLGQLTDENAQKLLKATGVSIDFGIEDWIINHAGGNPGILLAAVSVGDELRGDFFSFADSIGKDFERRIKEELGPEALKCARLFSVLEHTGISGAYEFELEAVCELFGEGWTKHEVLSSLHQLEKTGLANRGGSFAQITVPLLANYLTGQLLQGHRDEMFGLFAKLGPEGQIRFLKRLVYVNQVNGNEVEQFWKEMFAPQGPLGDLGAILKWPHLTRFVSGTVPNYVLSILETGLRNSSREQRLAILGSQRRELMFALEQLLFRSGTSKQALRLIWLLAEAENENYGNNATGVLKECFHPFHSQMPLPLEERLALIREFISDGDSSVESKQMAIEAIRGGLERNRITTLRHSSGFSPLDSRPSLTYGGIWSYLGALVEILLKLAQEEEEVSAVAKEFLPEAVKETAIQGSPKEGIEYFRTLKDWVESTKNGIDVSKLYSAIKGTRDSYVRQLADPEFPPERREEFEQYIADLGSLQTQLETSSFEIRLKRWAGRYGHRVSSDYEKAKTELDNLAAEAIGDPQLLSSDLLEWLVSSSVTEHRFFFLFLGKRDASLAFTSKIVELAKEQKAIGAFSSYFEGWAQRDPSEAEKKLDELSSSKLVGGEAIVDATNRMGPSIEGVGRIQNQLLAHRVDPEFAAEVLRVGGRLKNFQPNQFEIILKAIAGEDFKCASAVVSLIDTWLYHEKPIEGSLKDFAWLCLQQGRSESSTDAWRFDELVANLTNSDPERGFQLLEGLLSPERLVDEEGHPKKLLDPFAIDGGELFWKALYQKDRKRLIRLILQAAKSDALVDVHLSWRMKELIGQVEDKDVLIEIAKTEVELARVIASWMTSRREGFWSLAFELHQMYPNDERLHANLAAGIEQMGSFIRGPMSQFYETRKGEIEKKLEDPSTPIAVKPWLREMVDRLGHKVSSLIVWEYDMDVNHLVGYIRDNDSSQRLWAIGRVLKFAKWEDIRRLLTVEDIVEALPHVDLPEKRRTMLEQALPVWQHG